MRIRPAVYIFLMAAVLSTSARGVAREGDFWERLPFDRVGFGGLFTFPQSLTGDSVYLGTEGGLYVTGDAGGSWIPTSGGVGTYIVAVVSPKSDPNSIYVVGFNPYVLDKSADGGRSWSRSVLNFPPIPSSSVGVAAVDASNPSLLYVADQYELHRSRDGGLTFDVIGPPTSGFVNGVFADPIVSGRVFTAVTGVFYRSTDFGDTWTAMTAGLPVPGDSPLIAADAIRADVIYASPDGGSLYRSTNGGTSWSRLPSIPGKFILSLAVDGASKIWVEALISNGNAGSLFRSSDGASWVSVPLPPVPPGASFSFATAISPWPTGHIFSLVDGAIDRLASNGSSWLPASNGLSAVSVPAIAVDPNQVSTVLAATDTGFLRTTDGGETWTNVLRLFSSSSVAISADSSVWLAGALDVSDVPRAIFRSTDGGSTWTLSQDGLGGFAVLTVTFAPGSSTIAFAGTAASGAYRSDDGGRTWARLSALQPTIIPSFGFDARHPGTVYVATNGDTVYKSTDYGDTWALSYYGHIQDQVWAVAADPSNPSTIYAGTGKGGIFRSSDSGGSWFHVGDDPHGSAVSSFVFDQTSGSVYASTGPRLPGYSPPPGIGTVLRSSDGLSWVPLESGLDFPDVLSLAATPKGAPFVLYAGTNGGGVFRFPSPVSVTAVPSTPLVPVDGRN